MKKEKITRNDLLNDLKEIKKSLARSKKIKQKFFDLINEKSKMEIPEKIKIMVDFQVW